MKLDRRWTGLVLALTASACASTGSPTDTNNDDGGGTVDDDGTEAGPDTGPNALDTSSSPGVEGSTEGPGPDETTTEMPADTTGGSDETTGGVDFGEVGEPSDLPVPPTTGIPQPSGTADGLEVLDWAGFGSAVSYTFDDANTSQIASYDALQALGVPFSFYLITNKPESNDDIWERALDDGHELGNHTQSHLNTGQGDLAADTDIATQFIENRFGITVYTMAAPFGAADYQTIASTRFLINRGVGGTQVAPNDNTSPLNIPCFIPDPGAPASDFNARVDTGRTTRTWHTVLVHGFEGFPAEQAFQPVALDQFEAAVNYAKDFGDVWIGTVLDVGAYWIAQRFVNQVVPTTSGDATTWEWDLPDFFPRDQFLRVTVNGGTLRQGDVTLAWDEHGYYEVSLDAGSLTLSP